MGCGCKERRERMARTAARAAERAKVIVDRLRRTLRPSPKQRA